MRKVSKKIAVFDLDGTLIDSSHRTPNKPDGTLDLQGYYKNKTRENVFKDELLPLVDEIKEMYASGDWHIVICTAREMNLDDFDFLDYHGIKYDEIYERNDIRKKYHWALPDPQYKTKQLKKYKNTSYIFYDDAKPTIDLFNTYPNVDMVDANTANGARNG